MSSTAILQECTGRSCGLCKTALDTAKSPPARPSHRTPEQPGPAFAAPTASPRFVAASSTASRSGRRGGQAGLGGSGKGAGGGGGGALARLEAARRRLAAEASLLQSNQAPTSGVGSMHSVRAELQWWALFLHVAALFNAAHFLIGKTLPDKPRWYRGEPEKRILFHVFGHWPVAIHRMRELHGQACAMAEMLEFAAMVLLLCALIEMHPIPPVDYFFFLALFVGLVLVPQRAFRVPFMGKQWLPGQLIGSFVLLVLGTAFLGAAGGPPASVVQAALLSYIAVQAMHWHQGNVQLSAGQRVAASADVGGPSWAAGTANNLFGFFHAFLLPAAFIWLAGGGLRAGGADGAVAGGPRRVLLHAAGQDGRREAGDRRRRHHDARTRAGVCRGRHVAQARARAAEPRRRLLDLRRPRRSDRL